MILQEYENLSSPLLKKYFILSIIGLFCLLIIVFTCHLDETITADGIIRTNSIEASVQTLFSGKVDNIFYENTQIVQKGQVLFTQNCKYEKEYLKNLRNIENLYDQNISSLKQLEKLLNNTTIIKCIFDPEIMKTNSIYSSFVNQYRNLQNELNAKENYYERQKLLYPSVISQQDFENIENEIGRAHV